MQFIIAVSYYSKLHIVLGFPLYDKRSFTGKLPFY